MTVKMPDPLHRRLGRLAVDMPATKMQIVINALEAYIAKEEAKYAKTQVA